MEGGPFFKEVLYGDSHQGSAVNLLNGRAEVAAFVIHVSETTSKLLKENQTKQVLFIK